MRFCTRREQRPLSFSVCFCFLASRGKNRDRPRSRPFCQRTRQNELAANPSRSQAPAKPQKAGTSETTVTVPPPPPEKPDASAKQAKAEE